MVAISTVVAVEIVLFITLLLPFLAYIVYGLKNRGKKGIWSAWLLGALGFFVMQIVFRTSILSMLSMQPWFQNFAMEHFVVYSFVPALSAALFEVVGRLMIAKTLCNNFYYERAFAAGMGHGGIESMLLVGITYVSNQTYISMINDGSFDALVEQTAASGVDTAGLLQVKEQLISAPAGLFYLAGYERILTMIFQIALSLIVCYFVVKKQDLKGIGICVGIHFTVDFVASVVNGMATEYMGNILSETTAYIIVYIFLTAVAAASVLVIRKIRKDLKAEDGVV